MNPQQQQRQQQWAQMDGINANDMPFNIQQMGINFNIQHQIAPILPQPNTKLHLHLSLHPTHYYISSSLPSLLPGYVFNQLEITYHQQVIVEDGQLPLGVMNGKIYNWEELMAITQAVEDRNQRNSRDIGNNHDHNRLNQNRPNSNNPNNPDKLSNQSSPLPPSNVVTIINSIFYSISSYISYNSLLMDQYPYHSPSNGYLSLLSPIKYIRVKKYQSKYYHRYRGGGIGSALLGDSILANVYEETIDNKEKEDNENLNWRIRVTNRNQNNQIPPNKTQNKQKPKSYISKLLEISNGGHRYILHKVILFVQLLGQNGIITQNDNKKNNNINRNNTSNNGAAENPPNPQNQSVSLSSLTPMISKLLHNLLIHTKQNWENYGLQLVCGVMDQCIRKYKNNRNSVKQLGTVGTAKIENHTNMRSHSSFHANTNYHPLESIVEEESFKQSMTIEDLRGFNQSAIEGNPNSLSSHNRQADQPPIQFDIQQHGKPSSQEQYDSQNQSQQQFPHLNRILLYSKLDLRLDYSQSRHIILNSNARPLEAPLNQQPPIQSFEGEQKSILSIGAISVLVTAIWLGIWATVK